MSDMMRFVGYFIFSRNSLYLLLHSKQDLAMWELLKGCFMLWKVA